MDSIAIAGEGEVDDFASVQIRGSRFLAANKDGAASEVDMRPFRVALGVNSDGFDLQRGESFDDPDRDLSPVRDEHLANLARVGRLEVLHFSRKSVQKRGSQTGNLETFASFSLAREMGRTSAQAWADGVSSQPGPGGTVLRIGMDEAKFADALRELGESKPATAAIADVKLGKESKDAIALLVAEFGITTTQAENELRAAAGDLQAAIVRLTLVYVLLGLVRTELTECVFFLSSP